MVATSRGLSAEQCRRMENLWQKEWDGWFVVVVVVFRGINDSRRQSSTRALLRRPEHIAYPTRRNRDGRRRCQCRFIPRKHNRRLLLLFFPTAESAAAPPIISLG